MQRQNSSGDSPFFAFQRIESWWFWTRNWTAFVYWFFDFFLHFCAFSPNKIWKWHSRRISSLMTFAPNRIQQNRAPKIKFLFALPISKKSGYLHRMRSANLPFFCGFYSVAIRAFFSLFGLWETLGDSADALGGFGKLGGGFGRLWGAFGRLWGCPPPVAEQQKQLYTKILGVRKLPISQLCWPDVSSSIR